MCSSDETTIYCKNSFRISKIGNICAFSFNFSKMDFGYFDSSKVPKSSVFAKNMFDTEKHWLLK